MKTVWIVLVSFVVTALTVGGGTYYFMSSKAKEDKEALQLQITTLDAKLSQTEKSFTETQATLTTTTTSQVTFEKESTPTFKKDPEKGYYGTLALTGYLTHQSVPADPYNESSTETIDYVSFKFSKSNSNLINDYLSENQGNSFVATQSVGIGCYDKGKNKIYSPNFGDSGNVENSITGSDLASLLGSGESKEVKLQLTKPIYTSGMGAPACYSQFRDYKLVQ
jgi:uncharacterized protein YxeA